MDSYVYAMIALGFFTALGYFHGRRRNRIIGGRIGSACEKALKPLATTYVNIGGTIGYHFRYELNDCFTEARGTLTLLPRQSILYLPLSLLVSRFDRFYLTLFCRKRPGGEAHLVEERYFSGKRVDIAGHENLHSARVEQGGRTFLLFWDNPKLEVFLRERLEKIRGMEKSLFHFCVYRDNGNIFIHAVPGKESMSALLESLCGSLEAVLE